MTFLHIILHKRLYSFYYEYPYKVIIYNEIKVMSVLSRYPSYSDVFYYCAYSIHFFFSKNRNNLLQS